MSARMNGALVPRNGRRPRGPSLRSASSASSRAAAASNEACSSIAFGTARHAAGSRVPCHPWRSPKSASSWYPQLTTSGSIHCWCSGRAHRKPEPLGAHSHLWQLPAYTSAPSRATSSGSWPGTWAPSTIERTPARRAASQISATGSTSAVGEVMCETTTARVRIPMFETSSSGSTRTTFARMNSSVRRIAPYSCFVVRISSSGRMRSERITALSAAVAFGVKTRSSGRAPTKRGECFARASTSLPRSVARGAPSAPARARAASAGTPRTPRPGRRRSRRD